MGPRGLFGDDRLARLAAEGDERAFARIYERHHQALYRYCRSILRNDEDAADALQNTMVKALRALPGESRSIALKPWLYRIAHNEAISLLRRRGNDRPIDEVVEVEDTHRIDGATRERLRTLLADLAHLPERQRGALVMRELSGLSYNEIGAALDSSPVAAKQSVYEAREALHQLAEGRAMDCEAAHGLISANDRRILRGRKLRAHLRSCEGCRGYERAIKARPADLALLAPPLSVPASAAVLEGILGGGGGGGSTGGGVLGVLTGATGNTAAGSAALKASVAAVTIAAGVGGYEVAQHGAGLGADPPASSASGRASSSAGSAGRDAASAVTAREAAPWKSASSTEAGGEKGSRGGGPRADSRSNAAGGGTPFATPPGHGGTPPGLVDEGGTPPGLGGGAPPGQDVTPPGLPPGQGGTPPGHGGSPPGLGGNPPPGLGGTPPGRGVSPPGGG